MPLGRNGQTRSFAISIPKVILSTPHPPHTRIITYYPYPLDNWAKHTGMGIIQSLSGAALQRGEEGRGLRTPAAEEKQKGWVAAITLWRRAGRAGPPLDHAGGRADVGTSSIRGVAMAFVSTTRCHPDANWLSIWAHAAATVQQLGHRPPRRDRLLSMQEAPPLARDLDAAVGAMELLPGEEAREARAASSGPRTDNACISGTRCFLPGTSAKGGIRGREPRPDPIAGGGGSCLVWIEIWTNG